MSCTAKVLRIIGAIMLVIIICAMFYYVAILLVQTFFTTSSATSATTTTAKRTSSATKEETAKTSSTAKLQTIVDSMSTSYGSNVAIVLDDLSTGGSASVDADVQYVSASIYKLFVAYGIYRKIDTGEVSLTDSMSAYGTSSTVQECVSLMLTISDNTCGVALGQLYGWADLDSMLSAQGYTGTQLNNYDDSGYLDSDKLTTANDVATLLTRLYNGTLLSANSTSQFIELLKADQINYMLPSGLPSGTVCAHKVGYLADYQHDAGILYGTNGDMIVVMLTKGWATPTTDAAAAFKVLGQAVWSYLSV